MSIPSLDLSQFFVFTLVLVRTSAVVMTVPVLGASGVPRQVRVFLSIAIALLLTPAQLGGQLAIPTTLLGYLITLGCETLLGLVLGLGVMIVMSGVQLAGQIISQLGGMSLAEALNPDLDSNVPLLSQALNMFALAIFVVIGGHRLVLGGLLDTFVAMPAGTGAPLASFSQTLVTLLAQSCDLGVRIAAPCTVALLISNVVLGLITRTLPQLNVLSFGFGIGALMTFAALSVSLATMAWVLQGQIDQSWQLIQEMWE
jgi:flagellar biosynthetic protein FliR